MRHDHRLGGKRRIDGRFMLACMEQRPEAETNRPTRTRQRVGDDDGVLVMRHEQPPFNRDPVQLVAPMGQAGDKGELSQRARRIVAVTG